MNKKWLAPIPPYLAVWAGLFLLKSAWAALIGFHIAILFAIMIARPVLPINALFKSKDPKWMALSILFCVTSGIGLYFFWDIFGVAGDLPNQLKGLGLNSFSWPMFMTYFVLVNPFVEEYFWRGILGSDIKQLHGMDVIFAGYHAMILWDRVHPFSILFALAVLTSAGWLWRQIAREDKGLLAPSLGHMTADLSILLTVYWLTV
jgi:membrane protease YdiL (CAAX protease family)